MKRSIITAAMCAAVAVSAVTFAGAAVTATPTRDMGQTVYVDGTRVYPTGYNIADNNYFKLRDIVRSQASALSGIRRRRP